MGQLVLFRLGAEAEGVNQLLVAVGIDQPNLAEGADALGQCLWHDTGGDQVGGSRRQPGLGGPEGIQIGCVQKACQLRNLMWGHQIGHRAANFDPFYGQRIGASFRNEGLQCARHHYEPTDFVA